jgi:hypothetical protein
VAALRLGPLLRHVGTDDATVRVKTDAPCEVEVLGHRQRTFELEAHDFALVHVTGLEPGGRTAYEVRLDGEPVWPPPDSAWPPSCIRGNLPFTRACAWRRPSARRARRRSWSASWTSG